MKILVIGAGPAGLMFASQLKRKQPDWQISIVEKNRPDEVIGWGVVLPGEAKKHPANPLSYIENPAALQSQYLTEFKLSHHQESFNTPTGLTLCGTERKGLVSSLRDLCLSLGIDISYSSAVTSAPELHKDNYDLIVAANGVNHKSTYFTEHLKPSVDYGKNRYIWFGTPHLFKQMNLIFRAHATGVFVAHAYQYSPTMSTFVVECDEATYQQAGLENMTAEESASFIATIFADELTAQPLIQQPGLGWRNFMTLSHDVVRDGNLVLLGDAQQSGHFSIGQGTTMAVVQAHSLVSALTKGSDIESSLQQYEQEILPVLTLFRNHANISRKWFETINERMHLSSTQLAQSFNARRGSLPSLPDTLAKTLGKALNLSMPTRKP